MKDYQLAMLGIDMLGQCVDCKAETSLEKASVTLQLKILDIIYSHTVPPADIVTEEGARNAWQHLLMQFFLRHATGNRMVYSDGTRDLTDEERKVVAIQKGRKMSLIK